MGGRRRGCFFNWIRSDIPYFASEDSSSSVVLLSVRSIPPTEQPPPRHDSSTTDTNEPQRRLLSQINDRFRRTLSLEDPQEASYQQYGRENRPKSMVQNTNVVRANNQNATLTLNPTTKPSPKKKRFKSKFFFSLENFLHSRQSVATSDDLSSSKYCKFELESAESSPLFKGRNTPDLLDVPGISNEQLRCKKRLDKLENHFNKIQQLKDERLPLDNRDRTVYEDIVYSESLYSSKSTLVIGNAEEQFENSKCLDRYDDLDVKEPRAVGFVENNADVAYVINIEENDVLINDRTKELVVKIMDKSVDSIGSCSLDVDADNTDFSDTTSGSLNILTPSSAGSHIRDFTSRLQERAGPGFLKQDLQTLNEEQQDCRKKPSYLHLACSVNGYNNITTYDSKLRQKLNKSREASPGRIGNTTDMLRDCTDDAMASRLNSNSIFKTSFSESSISSQNVVTVTKTNGTQKNVFETHASRSYHLISNGGAESPTKSFIQQRVERLYGPGALAQGFFNQKRVKTISQCEEEKNALNGGKIVNYMKSPEGIHQVSRTHYLNRSPNGVVSESVMTESLTNGENCDPALPVLRHLRPEFRAQLPILSPKRSVPFRNADNDFNISSDHETSQNNLSNPRLTSADVVDRASPAKVEQIKTHHVNVVKSVPHVTIVPIERELDVCKLVPSVNGTVKLNTEFSKLDVKAEEVKSDACKVNGVKKETVVAVAKESLDDNCNRVSEAVSDAVQVKDVPADGQDGHYFLELKRAETERLIRLAETAERDLEELLQCGDTSEEVLGFLRAAAGKARLLATQKMQQFEGLCHNNLNRRADEPFPTTNSDLRGFWDMVSLQLTHVALIFSQLEAMRAGGWKEVPAESKPADAPKPKQTRPKKIPAAAKPSIDPARAKKREEQRKLLASVRAKKNQQEEDEVQIFAPAKSSS